MIKLTAILMMAIISLPEQEFVLTDDSVEETAIITEELIETTNFETEEIVIAEEIKTIDETVVEEINELEIIDTPQSTDEDAKKVLDALSKKTHSHKTMTLNFKISIKSGEGNIAQTGKAITKGDKFSYSTEEREVYGDGESVWSFNEEDNECYIDDMDEVSNGFNPSEIMTIWEDNFTYQYLEESKSGSDVMHKIKLFPIDPKKSKYHTVTLTVNGTKSQIKKASIKMKDGVIMVITITKFTPNLDISDSKFKWDKTKHPGVKEIDNRF